MTDTEILDQLTQIFRDVFGDDTIVARPDMSAEDIPEWNLMNSYYYHRAGRGGLPCSFQDRRD